MRNLLPYLEPPWLWLRSVRDRRTDKQTEWPLAIARSNSQNSGLRPSKSSTELTLARNIWRSYTLISPHHTLHMLSKCIDKFYRN